MLDHDSRVFLVCPTKRKFDFMITTSVQAQARTAARGTAAAWSTQIFSCDNWILFFGPPRSEHRSTHRTDNTTNTWPQHAVILVWIADLGRLAVVDNWIFFFSWASCTPSLHRSPAPWTCLLPPAAPWTSIHQRNHTAHTRTRGGRLELKSIKLQYIGRLIEPARLHGRYTKTVQILIKSLSCVRVAAGGGGGVMHGLAPRITHTQRISISMRVSCSVLIKWNQTIFSRLISTIFIA